ncbi:ATP-grasp domain-containing protein [Thermoactinospora rubra]|uniref:ATP-grasp domain-containing protein n=1 Tax=Thermoactinospora rubra TaxID=1088767 RepID=UPI000A10F5B2|nr:hypothetical protein [Thermoactinospora rubra]
MTALLKQYTFRLTPPADDQVRPPPSGDSAADGCVVFFTRRADPEVSELTRLLTVLGVPSRRIDADSLSSIELDLDTPGILRIDGDRVRITACWTRRFWPSAMAVPRTSADVLRRDSWLALVRQAPTLASVAWPGPRLGLLQQLTDAVRVGIRVPPTVVSTDPVEAARRFSGDMLIVKTLGMHFVERVPGTLEGIFPCVRSRADIQSRDRLPETSPLVIQEYVRHEAEYRVYFIQGKLITLEVRKPSPDAVWRDQESVQVRETKDVPEVAALVTCLAARWKLHFGAFDVLLADDGPVFLEVNFDGDWRWYERRAGVRSISRTIACAIRDRHRHAGGRVDRSGAGLLPLMTG